MWLVSLLCVDSSNINISQLQCIDISADRYARLAQLVERQTFNLVVVGSSPTVGTRVVDLKQLGL